MKDQGYGAGYVYAHDVEEGVGGIDCLPDALQGERFYRPTDRGFEAELGRRLERFRELRREVKERRQGEGREG
jgi:putative ATPase